MINFYNQVPSVYTTASRDFQYLSWLINIVLNSVKHNVDDLYNLPNTKADPRLTELLALTLGFKVKRNYNQEQLAALVSIIPSILKYKGTKKAIIMAARALLNTSGTSGDFDEDRHCKVIDGNLLEVTLPKDLIDVTLFMDLMPYILPAGMSCRVVRKTQFVDENKTQVNYRDTLYAFWQNVGGNISDRSSSGLSGLYAVGEQAATPDFANYIMNIDENNVQKINLNAGLMDNTVIPTLDPVDGTPFWSSTEANLVKEENKS